MESSQDLLSALDSSPDSLEQDYLKAYVPHTKLFPVLKAGDHSNPDFSTVVALPPAWRTTQFAVARSLELPLRPGAYIH